MKKHKIPVVMASGYLGSGKTTLISYLLNSQIFKGKKIAVLINEFGQLPIDGALLPQGDYFLAEINKGSIFCVCVKTDLLRDMEKIARDIQPDVLLIEATGVAEPRDISLLLDSPFLQESYGTSLIITIVDALNFAKLATILPALSAQVISADVVLLNKIDCVDDEELQKLESTVKRLNPVAVIFHTQNAVFPFEELSLETSKEISSVNAVKNSDTLCQAPPVDIYNCEFRTGQIQSKIAFYDYLDKYRNMILRGKGIVDFGTDKKYIEIVNGVVSSRPGSVLNFVCDSPSAISFVLRIPPEEFMEGLQGL